MCLPVCAEGCTQTRRHIHTHTLDAHSLHGHKYFSNHFQTQRKGKNNKMKKAGSYALFFSQLQSNSSNNANALKFKAINKS